MTDLGILKECDICKKQLLLGGTSDLREGVDYMKPFSEYMEQIITGERTRHPEIGSCKGCCDLIAHYIKGIMR